MYVLCCVGLGLYWPPLPDYPGTPGHQPSSIPGPAKPRPYVNLDNNATHRPASDCSPHSNSSQPKPNSTSSSRQQKKAAHQPSVLPLDSGTKYWTSHHPRPNPSTIFGAPLAGARGPLELPVPFQFKVSPRLHCPVQFAGAPAFLSSRFVSSVPEPRAGRIPHLLWTASHCNSNSLFPTASRLLELQVRSTCREHCIWSSATGPPSPTTEFRLCSTSARHHLSSEHTLPLPHTTTRPCWPLFSSPAALRQDFGSLDPT